MRQPEPSARVDLPSLVTAVVGQGPLWTSAGPDLNANFLVWPEGGGVPEHTNDEVEVIVVGIVGAGLVTVAGQPFPVTPGVVVVIPKGAARAITSRSPRFGYLSVHRRRAGLRPA